MRKSAIIRIIIYSILLVLLAGIFATGLHWYRTGNSPWNWAGWNFSVGGYNYKNSSDYSVGAGELDSAGITKLEINWMDGEVNIVSGRDNKILLEEESGLEEKNQLRYLVSGNTLIIQYAAPRMGLYRLNENKHLTVTLPVSVIENLEELEVDAVSAKGFIRGVTAGKCDIDNVSGNYEIIDCNFGKLSFDNVSGHCTFTGSADELNMDTVSGDLKAEFANIPRKIDGDAVSGEVTLTIPEGAGFTVEYDSVSGDLNCDKPMTKKGGYYICGDGEIQIEVDSVSGDLTIHGSKDRLSPAS